MFNGTIRKLISNSLPAGTIIINPSNIIKNGYLECNGQTVSRTVYAKLFEAIGVIYGAGDGSTTFKIPDLRGEFIRGFDNGRGADAGRTLGSYQANDTKSHGHTASTNSTGAHGHTASTNSTGNHAHSLQGYTGGSLAQSANFVGAVNGYAWRGTTSTTGAHSHTVTVNSNSNHSHTVTVSSTGGTETRPRNISMMYLIKY